MFSLYKYFFMYLDTVYKSLNSVVTDILRCVQNVLKLLFISDNKFLMSANDAIITDAITNTCYSC